MPEEDQKAPKESIVNDSILNLRIWGLGVRVLSGAPRLALAANGFRPPGYPMDGTASRPSHAIPTRGAKTPPGFVQRRRAGTFGLLALGANDVIARRANE